MFQIIVISVWAGILSVLAPCVLPVIPVIFGGSLTNVDKYRPLRIIWSAMVCIFVFTLLLKTTLWSIAIPQSWWNTLSGLIIWWYGLTLVFPDLREYIRVWLPQIHTRRMLWGDVWSDIILWASLGPIFATCSPTYALLLGAVLPSNLMTGLVGIASYVLWFGWFLYILVLGGRRLVARFVNLADSHGRFKYTLGIILIVTGVLIMTGWMKIIESYMIGYWPGFLDLELLLSKMISE